VAEPTNPIPTTSVKRRGRRWFIGVSVVAVVFLAVALAMVSKMLGPPMPIGYSTNVTIALRYVADDGRTYSCTYDYGTPDDAPMPASVARQMNEKDWSETGQLMYDWAKNHPTDSGLRELAADDPRPADAPATWSAAMDRYIVFPPWQVQTDSGSEYALRTQARYDSNCEEGLG
jgi:hypothetical protein